MQTIQDSKIKSISVWFYIIAAFQLVSAYLVWSSGSGDQTLAAAAMGLAALDIVIGALFVVFGYFAGKKHAWAFVAGLVLYAIRTLLQFLQMFSPVALLIRGYLLFRIWQGLQACLAANRSDQAMSILNQRRLVMPQTPVETALPQAWVPTRTAAPQSSTPE